MNSQRLSSIAHICLAVTLATFGGAIRLTAGPMCPLSRVDYEELQGGAYEACKQNDEATVEVCVHCDPYGGAKSAKCQEVEHEGNCVGFGLVTCELCQELPDSDCPGPLDIWDPFDIDCDGEPDSQMQECSRVYDYAKAIAGEGSCEEPEPNCKQKKS